MAGVFNGVHEFDNLIYFGEGRHRPIFFRIDDFEGIAALRAVERAIADFDNILM